MTFLNRESIYTNYNKNSFFLKIKQEGDKYLREAKNLIIFYGPCYLYGIKDLMAIL